MDRLSLALYHNILAAPDDCTSLPCPMYSSYGVLLEELQLHIQQDDPQQLVRLQRHGKVLGRCSLSFRDLKREALCECLRLSASVPDTVEPVCQTLSGVHCDGLDLTCLDLSRYLPDSSCCIEGAHISNKLFLHCYAQRQSMANCLIEGVSCEQMFIEKEIVGNRVTPRAEHWILSRAVFYVGEFIDCDLSVLIGEYGVRFQWCRFDQATLQSIAVLGFAEQYSGFFKDCWLQDEPGGSQLPVNAAMLVQIKLGQFRMPPSLQEPDQLEPAPLEPDLLEPDPQEPDPQEPDPQEPDLLEPAPLKVSSTAVKRGNGGPGEHIGVQHIPNHSAAGIAI